MAYRAMQRQEPRPAICFAGQGAPGAINVLVGNLTVLLTAWTFLFFSVLSADLVFACSISHDMTSPHGTP